LRALAAERPIHARCHGLPWRQVRPVLPCLHPPKDPVRVFVSRFLQPSAGPRPGHGWRRAVVVSRRGWLLGGLTGLLLAVLNPWVTAGILLLLTFFACYMSALSWADLTYVLPATSLAYVLVALVGHFRLHEVISPTRWLGIALIAAGVGFVAAGPSVTPSHQPRDTGRDTVSHEVES